MFLQSLTQSVTILLVNVLACVAWIGQSDSLWQHASSSVPVSTTPSTLYNRTQASSDAMFHIYLPTVTHSFAGEILSLTNQLRAQNGCAPLTLSPTLSAAANIHSADMAVNNFVGHIGTDGSTLDKRLDEVGYDFTLAAENVAAGYPTAQEVVQAWYNETPPNDGHRRNILNCDLKEIGIGQAYNPSSTYRFYWTQDFGTP